MKGKSQRDNAIKSESDSEREGSCKQVLGYLCVSWSQKQEHLQMLVK